MLLVTSPDHMKRACLSFRAAGFGHIVCANTASEAIETDLKYAPSQMGGRPLGALSNAGASMFVRYSFWNNLGYELDFFREGTALLYYKLMGWI